MVTNKQNSASEPNGNNNEHWIYAYCENYIDFECSHIIYNNSINLY